MTDDSTAYGMRRPDVSIAGVPAFARERFGIDASATELGSNQDRNFLLTAADGTRRLLKIDNPVFLPEEIDAQTRGLQHLAADGIRVPEPVPGADGALLQPLTTGTAVYRARMLSFVEGAPSPTRYGSVIATRRGSARSPRGSPRRSRRSRIPASTATSSGTCAAAAPSSTSSSAAWPTTRCARD